jgi:hypothetical protein
VASREALRGLSEWSRSGWVEPQSPIRALVQRLLERLPGGVAHDRGQLAGDLGPVCRRHGCLGGDTAAREQVEAGGLETRRLALDPLVASHLVGADLGGPPEVAAGPQPDDRTPVPARSWFRGSPTGRR